MKEGLRHFCLLRHCFFSLQTPTTVNLIMTPRKHVSRHIVASKGAHNRSLWVCLDSLWEPLCSLTHNRALCFLSFQPALNVTLNSKPNPKEDPKKHVWHHFLPSKSASNGSLRVHLNSPGEPLHNPTYNCAFSLSKQL